MSSKLGPSPADQHFGAPEIQPLRCEIVDERIDRAGVGQHPAHLLLEYRRIRELSALRQIEQALIGDTAPQEERQAGRQFNVVKPIYRSTCWQVSRIAMNAK